MSVVPLYTLYPATPTLSVDAVHVRLICEDEIAVAVSPVGTVGACVSEDDAFVVADTAADFTDALPAASKAFTL